MTSLQLSQPGSSTYSSSTLHVGDGTWDASRDDFLLPNIQGLNFDTMRYNGMGNRFQGLAQYHTLILGHGVIAAITFLGVVPAAILIASFYHRNPRLALRIHIYLQILTVILTTIIFVLGYFAVGPDRSLTNPHHGIGLAIYVLVLLQAIGGSIIHRIEKGKTRYYIPIKLMLHQWLGRAVALLALTQIAIGLTLYGSPIYLFVLYALAMAALLVLYFVLTHQRHKRVAAGYDDRGSYVTGTQTEVTDEQHGSKNRGRLKALTAALTGGAGFTALQRRRSQGHQQDDNRHEATMSKPKSHAGSESYMDEKYNDEAQVQKNNGWRHRLSGGAAGLGGLAALRSYVKRDKLTDDDTNLEDRHPPLGGPVTQSTMHVNLMEEGRPTVVANDDWRRVEEQEAAQAAAQSRPVFRPRRSVESFTTFNSQGSRNRPGKHGGLTSLAALGGVGSYFQRRRERKELARVEAERQREYENQRIFGRQNDTAQYTDTSPGRPGRVGSNSPLTERTASPQFSRQGLPPLRTSDNVAGNSASHVSFPAPALQSPPTQMASSSNNIPSQNFAAVPLPASVPPPSPPVHEEARADERQRPRRYSNRNESTRPGPPGIQSAAATRASNALAPQLPVNHPSREHSAADGSSGHVESPPVSVKVKMHNDGRHVTLRRLNEEEATRERDARRREQQSLAQSERENLSDFSTNNPQRFRRGNVNPNLAPSVVQPGLLPMQQSSESPRPLPQITGASPPSALGGGGIGSPGAAGTGPYDTGTDMSAEYDSNRRRRRAERARAEHARQVTRSGISGGRVEFT